MASTGRVLRNRTMRTHDDSVAPALSEACLSIVNSAGVTRTSIRASRFMAPPWKTDRANLLAHRRNVAGSVVQPSKQPIVFRDKSLEGLPVIGIIGCSHLDDDLSERARQPHPVRKARPVIESASRQSLRDHAGVVCGFQRAGTCFRATPPSGCSLVKMREPSVRLAASQASEVFGQASHVSPSKVYAIIPYTSNAKSRLFSGTRYGR